MLCKSLLISFILLLFGLTGYAQTKEEAEAAKAKLLKSKGNTPDKFTLLLTLSNYNLLKAGELKEDLDSATVYAIEARKVSLKLHDKVGYGKTILQEAMIKRESGDSKSAIALAVSTINYAQKNSLFELQGDGYLEYARILKIEEAFDQKIANFKLAVALYAKAQVKMKEADALKELADNYIYSGYVKESVSAITKAIKIYKSINYKDLQYAYTILSTGNRLDGNLNKALEYALTAEKIAEKRNDFSQQRSTIYNHIALIYNVLDKNDLAIQYWDKAVKIALKNNDIGTIKTIKLNKISVLIKMKNAVKAIEELDVTTQKYPPETFVEKVRINYFYINCYMLLKQYDKAKPYYENLKAFYDHGSENDPGRIYMCGSIINYLQKTNQASKTLGYLKELKLLAEESNNSLKSEYELYHFKTDSAMGNFKSAIGHFQKHKILSDSIFDLEKSKQFSSLELEYETEKKDKNIKLLQQQTQIQNTKIQKDAVNRILLIVSIFVLILFMGLLYNRYRLKQEANRNLEEKRKKIKEQNELLKKLLLEKEWLIKEIHHRVKNNLQIVISLLNTQSAYLDNKDALQAIRNSQHRMHAMSLIHQKLYQSDNLASIDMSWYIKELIGYLRDCFDTDKKIDYQLDIVTVDLDVSQAVPLGLILNEAISNAIKYAFPNEGKGIVQIELKNTHEHHYTLTISDNGIGIPSDFVIENSDSLGMNLMLGLSSQIDGDFEIRNENGLKIIINFIKKQQLTDKEDTN
jgi:two-component sensor histidine kinase